MPSLKTAERNLNTTTHYSTDTRTTDTISILRKTYRVFYQKIPRPTVSHLIPYAAVGAFGTTAQYLTLLLLVEAWNASPILASTIGFCIGTSVNHILNHRFVFKSTTSLRNTALRFYLVAAVGLVLNFIIMYVLHHLLRLNYILSQVLGTAVVFLFGYTTNRFWTFLSIKRT